MNRTFETVGRQESYLAELKQAAGGPGPSWFLTIGEPAHARLRVVPTMPERILSQDVAVLTQWRNRYVTAFLTEFEASEPRTRSWLADRVGPDSGRVLFMVESLEGRLLGYMGLAFIDWTTRYGEADAVVRGVEGYPGLMASGLRALLSWAERQLGLERIAVRVRSDNPALAFYHKLGFQERQRESLRRVEELGMVTWVTDHEVTSSPISLVHMDWPITGRVAAHDSH